MAIFISIQQKGLVPKVSRSQIRSISTAAMRQIATSWHARYSAGKFTTTAARKYNYHKRRTKEIRTGKLFKSGKRLGAISGLPLVWSGESRQRAQRPTRILADSVKSSVSYSIRAFNRRPPGFPSGQMRFEFVRVLPSEERQLAKDAERMLRGLFSKRKKQINVVTSSQVTRALQ